MKTTAIYPNRIEDKIKLEQTLHLNEEGNEETKFFIGNMLFAIGYERIVYGDHGPYIEFNHQNIKIHLISKFGNHININNLPKNPQYYYFWMHPKENNTKVYLQLKTVHDLPNAPKRMDGKKSNFNRKEGYADYKIGKYYINPYNLRIME